MPSPTIDAARRVKGAVSTALVRHPRHPPGALDEIVFQPHADWRLELVNSDFDDGLAFIMTWLKF